MPTKEHMVTFGQHVYDIRAEVLKVTLPLEVFGFHFSEYKKATEVNRAWISFCNTLLCCFQCCLYRKLLVLPFWWSQADFSWVSDLKKDFSCTNLESFF